MHLKVIDTLIRDLCDSLNLLFYLVSWVWVLLVLFVCLFFS